MDGKLWTTIYQTVWQINHPDARRGYGIKGLGYGDKLHAIWGQGAVPLAWSVRPLNQQESIVAACQLAPCLPASSGKRYLVGDPAYDTNRLHEAVAAFSSCRRPSGLAVEAWATADTTPPARQEGLRLLRSAHGQRLYRQRGQRERQFGNATMRAEGLGNLPAHVRRLPRAKLYVQAKLILNGFRILANRQLTPLLVA